MPRTDLAYVKVKKKYRKNRKGKKIQDLRRELRVLKKKYKQAWEGERQPLTELREILKAKLKSTRKAEWHRTERKSEKENIIPRRSLRLR